MLVVDDEQLVRFALEDFFSLRGYRVDTAATLEEATALLERHGYAVVLTDLRLDGPGGGMEGLQVAALARARQPSPRVLVLTADGSPEVSARALAVGADSVLRKPWRLPELEQLVVHLLRAS